MKKLYVLVLLMLAGCGVAERTTCDNGTFNMACDALVGDKNAEQDAELRRIAEELSGLKGRVAALEHQMQLNIDSIGDLSISQNFLAGKIVSVEQSLLTVTADLIAAINSGDSELATALQNSAADLQQQIDQLELQQNSYSSVVVALQNNVNAQQVTLTGLLQNENIVEFHDFCGAAPGFNEIGMRTSSGKLVVYFETGGSRFLSVLKPGSYVTTDGSSCKFTVNAAGQVVNEHY